VQADNGATAGWAFGGLALAAIALSAMGLVTYRRSR
jgi:hypothetical protein